MRKKLRKSVLIIKPDGMEHRRQIIKRILAEGFVIVLYAQMVWSDWVLTSLYNHVRSETKNKIFNNLREKPGMVLVLQKEDAIRELRRVLGKKPDPRFCSRTSLRWKFRKILEVTSEGRFYGNVAHASRNIREFRRDSKLAQALCYPIFNPP